jgi:steroid 5-alpha reductase family enzyme
MNWTLWLYGLIPLTAMALAGWLYSLPRRNVNLVDSLWSLFFLAAVLTYASLGQGTRAGFLVVVVGLWALRLAIHLAVRNHGKLEDRRYQTIRINNSPGFGWKSLYIVFGLQAALAWLISLPLFVAAVSPASWNALDAFGVALMFAGLLFEATADWQLTAFKTRPENRGRVLDTGLWSWSRHPNYFGEACVWFGFGLIGVAAGSLWSLIAPVVMTALLLKVSGVSLLEKDIAERRPAYRDYIVRTSAFIPWPPRRKASHKDETA